MRLNPCSVFFGPPVDLKPYYQQKNSKELYKEISEKIMEGIRELELIAHERSEIMSQDSVSKIVN